MTDAKPDWVAIRLAERETAMTELTVAVLMAIGGLQGIEHLFPGARRIREALHDALLHYRAAEGQLDAERQARERGRGEVGE